MTDSTTSTTRSDWEKALERFTAYRILYEADDEWGPLHRATAWLSVYSEEVKASASADLRARFQAGYAAVYERHEAEFARHMANIYDPLIQAGMRLLRTPAPDLAAVQVKHDACNAENFRLLDYEDEEGELFGIIKADVKRLTGLEA